MVDSFIGLVMRCRFGVSGWGMVMMVLCDCVCGLFRVLVMELIVL